MNGFSSSLKQVKSDAAVLVGVATCPILCARSMACRSLMGFQSCSTNTTVSAPVRLRPRPPTWVVSSSTSMEGSLLNLSGRDGNDGQKLEASGKRRSAPSPGHDGMAQARRDAAVQPQVADGGQFGSEQVVLHDVQHALQLAEDEHAVLGHHSLCGPVCSPTITQTAVQQQLRPERRRETGLDRRTEGPA